MENPPAAEPPQREEDDSAHRALVAVARTIASGAELGSSHSNGHSRHTLPRTISFSQLSALHNAARQFFACDFVGGLGDSLFYSARKVQPSNAAPLGRKRTREDDVESMVDASLDALKSKMSRETFQRVHSIVVRLHRDLRGSQAELVVQNVGVQIRKLAPSDESPRVVVFARLHSGIAIPTARLRAALGEAWGDGALSVEPVVMGVGDAELALTPEAKASRDLGNLPLLLVFSLVPTLDASST